MKKYILPIILLISLLSRILFLNQFPIGLNADEAAIGYNAYSLIQTGKDEHGVSWPMVFRSFDDYKPPLYFYLVLPFVYLFGLSEWSVRLPSALLGTATVYLIYLISKRLFDQSKKIDIFHLSFGIPEIAALFLAVSPWAIHFSRGGWEVNAATFFLSLGVFGFTFRSYPLFVGSFVASLYTYHSARVIAPLLALSIVIIYFRQIHWRSFLYNAFVGVCLSLPIIFQMFSSSGTSRFAGVSIFADTGPLAWVHEMRRTDPQPGSLITKIKYNRYSAYAGKFVQNYVSHFSPQFLFVKGDVIDRSRTPEVGQLFYVAAIFLITGFFVVITNLRFQTYQLLLSWLLIAPIAAALTYQSPHALRAQNMIVPLSLFIAVGFTTFSKLIFSNKKLFFICHLVFVIALGFEFSRYLYQYFVVYPKSLPIAWQYGFRDMAAYIKNNESKYEKIIISTRYDQPYILTAFYLQYPPHKLQKELVFSDRDKYGFSTGVSFGKYSFKQIDYENDSKTASTLLVVADEPVENKNPIQTIKYSDGVPTLRLFSTSGDPVP